MSWKIIRLELAPTAGFPSGSPTRAYLVRLPLDDRDRVDEAARALHPKLATVRRHWPNEPDLAGYVVRRDGGWSFSYAPDGQGDEAVVLPGNLPVRIDELVMLIEPGGGRLPYRVSAIRDID